jgi:hypothetical protein
MVHCIICLQKIVRTCSNDRQNKFTSIDPSLLLFGLSGSHSISEANKTGLQTISEVFADRTYQNDGSLTPRTQSNALIQTEEASIQQVLQMINTGVCNKCTGRNSSHRGRNGLPAWRWNARGSICKKNSTHPSNQSHWHQKFLNTGCSAGRDWARLS